MSSDLKSSIPLTTILSKHSNGDAHGNGNGDIAHHRNSGSHSSISLESPLPTPVQQQAPKQGGNVKINPAFIIPVWICLSMGVILFNKFIFSSLKFEYPVFLVTWHLSFAVCSSMPSTHTTTLTYFIDIRNTTLATDYTFIRRRRRCTYDSGQICSLRSSNRIPHVRLLDPIQLRLSPSLAILHSDAQGKPCIFLAKYRKC